MTLDQSDAFNYRSLPLRTRLVIRLSKTKVGRRVYMQFVKWILSRSAEKEFDKIDLAPGRLYGDDRDKLIYPKPIQVKLGYDEKAGPWGA
jgi:hypothetical protein